jgi:hypothetical protein
MLLRERPSRQWAVQKLREMAMAGGLNMEGHQRGLAKARGHSRENKKTPSSFFFLLSSFFFISSSSSSRHDLLLDMMFF